MTDPSLQGWERYVAIDIHKHYVMVAAIDTQKRIVLQPRRVELARFPTWAQAHLYPSAAVVIEATTNAWAIYNLLVPLVGRVVVAHPGKVKQIAGARVKTDKVAGLKLARLLRADEIPAVWVPPPHVRDLRALLSHWVKLLVVVWHVLISRSVDRRADAEQVARVPLGWLMVWAWKLSDEQWGGLTSRQFIRYHLLRLGIGHNLRRIERGGTPRPIASIEDVLALRPGGRTGTEVGWN